MRAKRAKQLYTVHQRIAATARMIRALGRAVADDDPELLAELMALQTVLADAIGVAVAGQRRDHTWRTIGKHLGVTPQACVIRWGDVARDAGNVGPMRGNQGQ